MRFTLHCTVLVLAGWLAAGCNGRAVNENDPSGEPSEAGTATPGATDEPAYVTVDHILIGITHPRLKGVKRTAQEARELAYRLKMELESGADWQQLKEQHSDDPGPDGKGGGPYSMANHGSDPRTEDEAPRAKMVSAFGDVGFRLAVGEIGMADYDPQASKYGYHIIKRVK